MVLQGNFYGRLRRCWSCLQSPTLWLELNKKVNCFAMRNAAMKHKISFVPGKIFSASCNYSNCMRISFGKPWTEDMDYGLMMLGKLIAKMSR